MLRQYPKNYYSKNKRKKAEADKMLALSDLALKKPFKVSDIRDLLKLVSTDIITYGRMVELMNEKAWKYFSERNNALGGFVKPE